jgi:hypothetical protein
MDNNQGHKAPQREIHSEFNQRKPDWGKEDGAHRMPFRGNNSEFN